MSPVTIYCGGQLRATTGAHVSSASSATHLATSLQIKLIFHFFGKGSWQSDWLLSFCFRLLTMCRGENTLNVRVVSWHTRTKVSSLRIWFDGLGSGMPSFYERCQPSTPGFHYISHLWTFCWPPPIRKSHLTLTLLTFIARLLCLFVGRKIFRQFCERK